MYKRLNADTLVGPDPRTYKTSSPPRTSSPSIPLLRQRSTTKLSRPSHPHLADIQLSLSHLSSESPTTPTSDANYPFLTYHVETPEIFLLLVFVFGLVHNTTTARCAALPIMSALVTTTGEEPRSPVAAPQLHVGTASSRE